MNQNLNLNINSHVWLVVILVLVAPVLDSAVLHLSSRSIDSFLCYFCNYLLPLCIKIEHDPAYYLLAKTGGVRGRIYIYKSILGLSSAK